MVEAAMKKMMLVLVVCYGGFASHADAASLTLTSKTIDNGWEKVRMNCDQFGRCWKERTRNALLDSYNHAPPPRVRTSPPPLSAQLSSSEW
jgi:hypothetical protein